MLVFSHESPIAVFGNMANTTIEIQTLYVVDILTLAFLRFCVRSICSRDSGCDTVHLCRAIFRMPKIANKIESELRK